MILLIEMALVPVLAYWLGYCVGARHARERADRDYVALRLMRTAAEHWHTA